MNRSIRWLAPLVFSAAALVAAGAAAQSSTAAAGADSPTRDPGAAESGAAAAANAPAADAKAGDFDRTPTDCITITNINETAVIDDSTILFYMRGGKKVTYRISLPQGACPNLGRERRFSYKTTMNRLCDSDLITVLEQFGAGLREGFTCRLGKFYPIPYEEAELLRKEHDKPSSTRDRVKSKPVQVAPKSEAPPAAGQQAPTSEAPQTDSPPR